MAATLAFFLAAISSQAHRLLIGPPETLFVSTGVAHFHTSREQKYDRVVPGDFSPGTPTDPDVQNYRIRFLE